MLNNANFEYFLFEIRNEKRMHDIITSIQYCTGKQALKDEATKNLKVILVGKKETNLLYSQIV